MLDTGIDTGDPEKAEWCANFMLHCNHASEMLSLFGLAPEDIDVAQLAAEDGRIEIIMFSVNPAFDLMPATEDINFYRFFSVDDRCSSDWICDPKVEMGGKPTLIE